MKKMVTVYLLFSILFLSSCNKITLNNIASSLDYAIETSQSDSVDSSQYVTTGFSLVNGAILPLNDTYFQYNLSDGYKTDDQSIMLYERGMLSEQYYSIAALQKIYDTNARPDLFSSYPNDMPIPTELVKQAERSLFSGTIYEWLNLQYSKPKKLTHKQLTELEISASAKEVMDYPDEEFDNYAIYCFEADIDDDSKNEIVLYINSGGTGGFASFYILKQNKNGVYDLAYNRNQNTEGIDTLCYDSFFIQYKNRWYWVHIDLDYNFKYDTGISIYNFKNGVPNQYATVYKTNTIANLTPEGNGRNNTSNIVNICQAEANDILSFAVNPSENGTYQNGGNAVIESTFDSFDGYTFAVDVNNDGISEYVNENMWWPCNGDQMFLSTCWYSDAQKRYSLTANFKDSYDSHESYIENWLPHMMWFEKIDGKTYTFRVVRQMNSQLFLLNVFDVEGSTATPVYSMYLDYSQKYEVKTGVSSK